jgi:hypothetical protein
MHPAVVGVRPSERHAVTVSRLSRPPDA